MSLKHRGVWCGAGDAGKSKSEVSAFVQTLASAGFNNIFLNVKDGGGNLYWRSDIFPSSIAKGYESFDLSETMLEECSNRGIDLHAWFIDFYEGANGEAYLHHPEWACLDANGEPTSAMRLRGKPYNSVWMCPARRPGYVDEWLVPMYAEFASRYSVKTVHHDYIRYPGDAAPDKYCFCDYCLEEFPKWLGIQSPLSEEPFVHEKFDREFLESHWEPSPRGIPANWQALTRKQKQEHLLNGGFFVGGRKDMDYFYYRFRAEQINAFSHLARDAVYAANPSVGKSAAVFKHPIQSGRFIGQDWRDFLEKGDLCVPMNYRDHFPGSFEQYLVLLDDSIRQQLNWTKAGPDLWIGIAINFLYKEEPNGPYPTQKLTQVLECIDKAGVDGVVLFAHDQLKTYGLWKTVTEFFV